MPQPVLYYGDPNPLPEQRLLKAGPLRMVLEKGALRYLKLGDAEVVRMICSAVRDHNWITVEPVISGEEITESENGFEVSFACAYRQDDIHFRAAYRITGDYQGTVTFRMDGEALSTFRKNRIGLCVLHPITGCAGKPCEITSPDGAVTTAYFPEIISPHQPFENIRAMRWPVTENLFARLTFSGDVFETEDQRNWTDASYKTYCTPLALPFPVVVQRGERIRQSVTFGLEGPLPEITPASGAGNRLTIAAGGSTRLPAIGVGRSGEVELGEEDQLRVKGLGFSHYRADLRLYEPGWPEILRQAAEEATTMNLRLELALHFTDSDGQTDQFITGCLLLQPPLYALMLFGKDTKATPGELIFSAVPKLRNNFPGVKIGVGTDIYFTELNRNRPPATPADFLTFSLNPQVHASDNASLTETLAAQGDVLESARQLAAGKPVHVSPVTLRRRFNADATGPEPPVLPGQLPPPVDVRQMSLYGAAWTLGSLKYLAEAGAGSITCYETAGRRGLFLPATSQPDELFPGRPGAVFPMFAVFKEVLAYAGAEVVPCKSDGPLVLDGLVLRQEGGQKILLANFTSQTVSVQVQPVTGRAKVRHLNAETIGGKLDWPADFYGKPAEELEVQGDTLEIRMLPYGIGVVDQERW